MTDLALPWAEAKASGARFYLGRPCLEHGAIVITAESRAVRYTVNKRCVECCKADRRRHAQANAERERERKRAARAARKARAEFADLLG
ncbi:hypothetical protein [Mesorhizobium sp. B2-8-9]|uniref:hypothetical protein n=1 Tax=Mesorhizobium sp. B2-8-9 TaxID=2589899 RepID=UPI00112CF97E|nr:hypothetical protein [Mesorhizobium sp. B2-8-9]TPI86415.1 hypothetical protein FJ423_00910 [Mesorhizobium sp. B2-8-9]